MREKISDHLLRLAKSLRTMARRLWGNDELRLTTVGEELSIYLDCQADEHAQTTNSHYAGNYELLMMFLEGGGPFESPELPRSSLTSLTHREVLLAFVDSELDRVLRHLERYPRRVLACGSLEAPEAESLISAAWALAEVQGFPLNRLMH